MAILSFLYAFLLSSSALAAPTVYGRNSLETRGFRTPARHYRPKYPISKRQQAGVVQATTNGGGWLVVVQIGGQDVTLNVDTGSSDL